MEEWRLICSARQAEMQLINAYKRNHELHVILTNSLRETGELKHSVLDKLRELEEYLKFLSRIELSWVRLILSFSFFFFFCVIGILELYAYF
jgi:hypothetical protein